MKNLWKFGAAVLLAVGLAPSANALTTTCTIKKKDISFLLTTASEASCQTGNDSEIDDQTMLFNLTGWEIQDKNNEDKGGDPKFTVFTQDDLDPVKTVDGIDFNYGGDWTIDFTQAGTEAPEDIMLVLKQASGFAAFLLTTNDVPQSGTWATDDVALSHASIFTRGTVATVPLPAAAWFLITAFGGMGVAAQIKKKRMAA